MAGPVRRAHPALRPYVGAYVGYHHVVPATAVHHGVCSSRATVIVAFDEPLDVGWSDEPDHDGYWLAASGLHLVPALIRTHGHLHGIQLDLTPAGVRALLGVPAAALAGVLTEQGALPLGISSSVHEAMAGAPDWATRFDLLEAQLLALLGRHRSNPEDVVPPEVRYAWAVLARHHGRVGIEGLAREVGWSRRHLAARFANEYGVGPKQAARLMRFERARHLARAGRPLAETAHEVGFADQSHLAREWRALGGLPPRAALAEDVTFLQDAATAHAARWSA